MTKLINFNNFDLVNNHFRPIGLTIVLVDIIDLLINKGNLPVDKAPKPASANWRKRIGQARFPARGCKLALRRR